MKRLERTDINSIALHWNRHSGRFDECPFREFSFVPMDYGVLVGAIVVERIRTFGGMLHDWTSHWKRMQIGCETLDIRPPCDQEGFGRILTRLLAANRALRESEPDLSIVALATPGNPEFGLGDCTMLLHLLQIPWNRLGSWYQYGTPLVASPYASGAGSSWPASIKVRNRLAYFLADRDAGNQESGRLGLVRTANGCIGDTSVANLLMINPRNEWISPTPDSILLGTSFHLCKSLLQREGISIAYRDITLEELQAAREVILVGNTPCAWHASEIDGRLVGDGTAGPKCRLLQKLWIQHLGFDWLSQGLQPR